MWTSNKLKILIKTNNNNIGFILHWKNNAENNKNQLFFWKSKQKTIFFRVKMIFLNIFLFIVCECLNQVFEIVTAESKIEQVYIIQWFCQWKAKF